MTTDPRIDALKPAAVLTDTQVRMAFAPTDPDVSVAALLVKARNKNMVDMQSRMRLGRVHIQIKEGFGAERHIELSGPELMLILEMGDRLVTELPNIG